MTYIQERGSTHVYHVNRMSKEEMDHMISLCVHDQPAYCVAACPFKVDTKEMLFYAAKGNFKKALAIYEKITPFPMILCDGCTAPCEEKCKLCEIGGFRQMCSCCNILFIIFFLTVNSCRIHFPLQFPCQKQWK